MHYTTCSFELSQLSVPRHSIIFYIGFRIDFFTIQNASLRSTVDLGTMEIVLVRRMLEREGRT